jgi:hypothetical protein
VIAAAVAFAAGLLGIHGICNVNRATTPNAAYFGMTEIVAALLILALVGIAAWRPW